MVNLFDARPLTASLAQAAARPVTVGGQHGPRHEILAEMLWNYVIDGQVTLGCGDTVKPAPRDWITTAKWLVSQIDGKPPRPRREPSEIDQVEHESETRSPVSRVETAAPDESAGVEEDSEEQASANLVTEEEDEDTDGADPDEEETEDDEDAIDVPAPRESSQDVDYELRAQQIEAALHGTPAPQPAEIAGPPLPAPPPTYAYGWTPVTSFQPDGSVRLIDRADYERRRQQGFRNGTRHRITLRRDDG